MWIKKLKLENFQKHSNLEIDFDKGVNILYGQSDAGKSCIRRAIEWLIQNENIDGIRKAKSKKTVVTVTLDSNIEVERVRSQSINRYIIRKGKDEQTFDAIGKSIPDEVQEVLTIYPIEIDGESIYLNSQPQIGLPFLFDKSPSFRIKLFNKLTGNDVLDKLFSEFNKDILRIKRNKKEEEERYENRSADLKRKKVEMEKAEAVHSRLKKRVQNIKKLYENYSKLLELKQLREKNIENRDNVAKQVKNIQFPEPKVLQQLREKITIFDALYTAKNTLEKTKIGLERVRGQLKDLKLPTLNLGGLEAKIKRFQELSASAERLKKSENRKKDINRELKIIQKDLDVAETRYKKLMKELKVCPFCQTELTEKHLEEIHL